MHREDMASHNLDPVGQLTFSSNVPLSSTSSCSGRDSVALELFGVSGGAISAPDGSVEGDILGKF